MRRKEREVKTFQEKINILDKCQTIRIAVNDSTTGLPYIVPLSFGYEAVEDELRVYFHCAGAGHKADVITDGAMAFFEADIFDCVQSTGMGITTRFESLMAPAKISFMKNDAEKLHGLELICEHYGYGDYPIGRCKGLKPVRVVCLTIKADELTGKRNARETEVDYHSWQPAEAGK